MWGNVFYDTESVGLHGMPVLIQYAIDDGPIQLYSPWSEPIEVTLKLIENMMDAEANIAFNIASDRGIPIYFFETSPFVGYKVDQKFSVGLGAKYIYIGSKQANFTYSVYGGNIFSRYKFTESLFAHAEFEVLRAYNLDPNSASQNVRATVPMLFAGAGYNYSMGGTLNLQIMLLYDFIDNINSPYQGSFMFGSLGPPIIYRIGISIGM